MVKIPLLAMICLLSVQAVHLEQVNSTNSLQKLNLADTQFVIPNISSITTVDGESRQINLTNNISSGYTTAPKQRFALDPIAVIPQNQNSQVTNNKSIETTTETTNQTVNNSRRISVQPIAVQVTYVEGPVNITTPRNTTVFNATMSAPNTTALNITAPNTTAPNITVPNTTAPNTTANITAPNITVPNTPAYVNTTQNNTPQNITTPNDQNTPTSSQRVPPTTTGLYTAPAMPQPTTYLPNPTKDLSVNGLMCLQKCRSLNGISCKKWEDDSITCCEFTGCQWPFYCRPQKHIQVPGCNNKP